MFQESERPCIAFTTLNVEDPNEVGAFMYWLWHGKMHSGPTEWPMDWEVIKQQYDEDVAKNPWKVIEYVWGTDAPRQRMAQLLWQALQVADEQHFYQRFVSSLRRMAEDSNRCAETLKPVQQRLAWVLEGLNFVEKEAAITGQAAWGETWFLPPEQAKFVREQLQKAHPDLLQKESDYQDMVRATLNYVITEKCKLLDPPSKDSDRVYVGEILSDEMHGERFFVWVEGSDGRYPLLNARKPYSDAAAHFGWGYFGSGSGALSQSILADATDGNLEIAKKFWDSFLEDVVEPFPQDQPFRLTKTKVLEWLSHHGLTLPILLEEKSRLQEQKAPLESRIQIWTSILDKDLRAQRFDLVPDDFECALYLDLVEMIQTGGRVFHCARCGLPISDNGSPRSNRQRGRWLKGQPIYHPLCFKEVVAERKRKSWQRWAEDPAIRERRRKQAQERRRLG